jgi:hypothetical protein
MGIVEVLAGPQEPLCAIEQVRRLTRESVPVFKRFLGALASCVAIVREQARGELEIEGLFYPTLRDDVVRLEVTVTKRTAKGRITHACGCHIYFQSNEQGLLTEVLSSTVLPPKEG